MLDKDVFKRLTRLKLKLDDFCMGNITTWKDRILLECVYDVDFLYLCEGVFYNVENLSSIELDNIFKRIIDIAYKELSNYDCNFSLIEKYDYILKIERYYGIIEQIDELSALSENLYKKLISEYGYNGVSEIDKANPSILNGIINRTGVKSFYEDDDINKYLVLKKWQDLQNIFSNEILQKQLHYDEVEEGIYNNYLSKINVVTTFRKKYEILRLTQLDFIDINILSKYYAVGILDDFKKIIGGKAYGLAILNCYSDIPKTCVISFSANRYDLSKFIEKDKTYAVRSSADCEDSGNHSFAGMFESCIDVKPEMIDKSINDVKNSINCEKVKQYINVMGLNQPYMNVVIQEFINPDVAGVWIAGSIDSGVYEVVKGVGESLVSGKTNPTIHNFEEDDALSKYFVGLQKEIGTNCDFEFCIKGDSITMLQCRPVTTLIKSSIEISDGVGASCGEVEGEIQFLDDPSKIDEFITGKILVTYATDPNWVPAILKAKGIVTSFGGYLCHTSIIARELNKPCVVGVKKSIFEQVLKSKKIRINGFTGKIEILE